MEGVYLRVRVLSTVNLPSGWLEAHILQQWDLLRYVLCHPVPEWPPVPVIISLFMIHSDWAAHSSLLHTLRACVRVSVWIRHPGTQRVNFRSGRCLPSPRQIGRCDAAFRRMNLVKKVSTKHAKGLDLNVRFFPWYAQNSWKTKKKLTGMVENFQNWFVNAINATPTS